MTRIAASMAARSFSSDLMARIDAAVRVDYPQLCGWRLMESAPGVSGPADTDSTLRDARFEPPSRQPHRSSQSRAETMSGRKVNTQAIAAGMHSHDGGKTWSAH